MNEKLSGGKYYTDPDAKLVAAQLNSLGSKYAELNGKDMTSLIARETRKMIYDASDQRFLDLSILSMANPEIKPSDEFFYKEKVYGRQATVSTTAAAAATFPNTQTFGVENLDAVSVNTILTNRKNNASGNVTKVDQSAGTITIKPIKGSTLPAVAIGDSFAHSSNIDNSGSLDVKKFYRMSTIERYNYIQLFAMALKYDRVEGIKLRHANVHGNYVSMERDDWINQFRIDLSNQFWNGVRGEYTLEDGSVAKSMGGIYPLMTDAGSFRTNATESTIGTALEETSLSTRYKKSGSTRFLYGTSRNLLKISKYYKSSLTRYTPSDSHVNLDVDKITVAGEDIVLVPMDRFEPDSASFPSSWANYMFLIDQASVKPCQLIEYGESIIEVPGRKKGNNTANYDSLEIIEASLSIEFNNPLASGLIVLS